MATTSSSSKALQSATKTGGARKITLRNAIGYGIGDFYGGGQLTLISTYLSLFWTRFCGMDISTSQTIIGMSAMISAVAALLFGVFDDNLYRFHVGRRFGRRRLLLLVTSPLLLTGVFLWLPGLPLAVYFLAYTVWVVLVQLFATGYNPLPGEMTTDFDGRTMLSTVRMTVSTFSSALIPWAGSVILLVFGDRRPTGYMLLTIATTILFACTVLFSWYATWEMTPEQAGFGAYARGEVALARVGLQGWCRRAARMLKEYASTLRLGEFRRHVTIYLLVQMTMDVFGQVFIFYVVYDWNKTAAFASLLMGCSVVSMPLMPVFGWALTKIGLAAVLLGWFIFAMIACWIVSARLTISKETDLVVLREITRLRNGGAKSAVDARTKTVIERLSGVPYEQCWKG